MRTGTLLLALGLGLGLAACGDDTNGANGSLSDGCSGDYDKLMGALCDVLARCPDIYPVDTSSRDVCKATLCWASTCRLTDVQVGGTVTFHLQQQVPTVDPAAVQACLDWLNAVSCNDLRIGFSSSSSSSSGNSSSMNSSPCAAVLGGSSSSGSSGGSNECTSQSCPSGQFCKYGTTDVDAGVRTCAECTPLPTQGQPCTGQCASGLYCDDHFNTSTFTCVPQLADGSACYESGINQPCQSGFCNFHTLMCDPNGKQGDACTTDEDCRSNYCNAQGRCDTLKPSGTACASSSECQDQVCDPNTHTCGLANGSSCQPYSNTCVGYCDPSTSTCIAAKSDGAACQDDHECTSGFCAQQNFSSSSRVCAERCDAMTPCASGFVCNSFGACMTPQGLGADCGGNGECASGYCGVTGSCANPPTIGGACTDSSACFPIGYCSGGTCKKQVGPGTPCDAYDSCLAPYICLDRACVPLNLTCAPAMLGQQCAYLRVCDDQTYCDLASFTCKARVGAGATCSSDDECALGNFCDGMKCVASLASGAACMRDSQCMSGSYCVASASGGATSCTPGPSGQPCDRYDGPFCPDGYACTEDNRCLAGVGQEGQSCDEFQGPFCVAGLFCDGGTCHARRPLGGSCYDDSQCQSGACDRTVDQCLNSVMCKM